MQHLYRMFQRLKQKWKVSEKQLFLILCVFAITGTSTAWISKSITTWLQINSGLMYYLIKIFVLIFGYQFILLLVALPFGQFRFFWAYEKKILRRMKLLKSEKKLPNIAMFASGAGSNARKILEYGSKTNAYNVSVIISNKQDAGVLKIAEEYSVPTLIIEKEQFFRGDGYLPKIKAFNVDLIVLAGFLWKIPAHLIEAFPKKIINIHPALLPKFGGKGMYGMQVHKAVIEAGEKQSGITIHYVDEHYDNGDTIFQATCEITPDDTPDSLAQKIHQLEHQHFPVIIQKIANKL